MSYHGGAGNCTGQILDRRNSKGHIKKFPVFFHTLCIEMADNLPIVCLLEDIWQFIYFPGWNKERYRFSNDLPGTIPVHLLCTSVPGNYGSIEVFPDDSVVGKFNDICHVLEISECLFLFSYILKNGNKVRFCR